MPSCHSQQCCWPGMLLCCHQTVSMFLSQMVPPPPPIVLLQIPLAVECNSSFLWSWVHWWGSDGTVQSPRLRKYMPHGMCCKHWMFFLSHLQDNFLICSSNDVVLTEQEVSPYDIKCTDLSLFFFRIKSTSRFHKSLHLSLSFTFEWHQHFRKIPDRVGNKIISQWLYNQILKRLGFNCPSAVTMVKPWRPAGFSDVDAATVSRQSAQSWRSDFQRYAPHEDSWHSLPLETEPIPRGHNAAGKGPIENPRWLNRESKCIDP
jgi:hypothetical protein